MKNFSKILIFAFVFICVVIAATFQKLAAPSKERTDFVKKLEVVELLNAFTAMKMDYAVKLLTEELPSGSVTTGFKDFDLGKYGLMPLENIISDEGYQYERRIDLTASQIIVTFGYGFDGTDDRTFIFSATDLGEGAFDWSCTGGSLSNKYRPHDCLN